MLLLVDQNSGIGDLLGQKPDGSMLNGYQVDAMGRIATAKGVRNWRLFQNPNKLSNNGENFAISWYYDFSSL